MLKRNSFILLFFMIFSPIYIPINANAIFLHADFEKAISVEPTKSLSGNYTETNSTMIYKIKAPARGILSIQVPPHDESLTVKAVFRKESGNSYYPDAVIESNDLQTKTEKIGLPKNKNTLS